MRKREPLWLSLLVVLMSLAASLSLSAKSLIQFEQTDDIGIFLMGPQEEFFVSPEVGEVLTWQDCQVTVHPEPPTVRVSRNGTVFYGSPGSAHFASVGIVDLGDTPEPELVILNDYGGTYTINDIAILGGRSQEVWYEAESVPYARVCDFTGDGKPELAMTDRPVGPFKGYPTLLFQVGPEGAVLSPNLMKRRRLPSVALLEQEARESRWPYPDMWHYNHSVEIVANLIYCGRMDLARRFMENGFKAESDDIQLEAYWEEILSNLESSPHWDVVREMNSGQF